MATKPTAHISRKAIIAVIGGALGVLLFGLLASRHQSQSSSVSAQLLSLDEERFPEALKQITTNEIPVLLEMLAAKDSTTKTKVVELLDKAPWLQKKVKTDAAFHYRALAGFEALGSNAVPAIPQLGKMLMNGGQDGGHHAAFCLAVIGRKSIPMLVEALTNSDYQVRYNAAAALGSMGSKAKDAIPSLIQALADKNRLVRCFAARALGRIKMEPLMVVPALIMTLDDQEMLVKCHAAIALGEFGEKAKAAVLRLSILAKGTNTNVSSSAVEALQKIEPDAVGKIGDNSKTKLAPSK